MIKIKINVNIKNKGGKAISKKKNRGLTQGEIWESREAGEGILN